MGLPPHDGRGVARPAARTVRVAAARNHAYKGIVGNPDRTVESGNACRPAENVGVGTDSSEMRLDASGSARASGAFCRGTRDGTDDDFPLPESGPAGRVDWEKERGRSRP
ncbi:MAG: hypothetical protein ABIH26_09015 [Candidatus Eisenbacteria bacterium]